MQTVEWVVCFVGAAVAVATLCVWLAVRRHRHTAPEPVANPGLIQPDVTPGPPGSVSPAMLGALLDGKVAPRDIFLTIVDLAVRGYLTLTPLISEGAEPYDWAIRRLDKPARGLRDFEATLLDAPVTAGKAGPTATLSSLVGDAQTSITASLAQLRGAVARAGWFSGPSPAHPRRSPWAAGGGLVLLLGLAGAAVALVAGFSAAPWPGLVGAALIVVSGLLIISLNRLRPATTPAGDLTRAQVQRYRGWLTGLQPHDIARDETRELFDTNLVPALAFGCEAAFATVFDTAVARHQSWGNALTVDTPWLSGCGGTLAQRVQLLDLLLADAVSLAEKAGLDEPGD